MHLLFSQKDCLSDTDGAIDLKQEPADVVFISSADSDLACITAAHDVLDDSDHLSLRVANMMVLSHPLSIDIYCEQTIVQSSCVIIRCLGGESYWQYGLEKIQSACCSNNIKLIVLPGDDKPDLSLEPYGTVNVEIRRALWSYWIHGGIINARLALLYVKALICDETLPLPIVQPLLKAGLWLADINAPLLSDIQKDWSSGSPVVAIIFYRALVQAGNTEPIDALCSALTKKKMNPLPVFVSSLKDEVSQATVRFFFEKVSPSVVINLTGFCVSQSVGSHQKTVLEEGGAIILQAVLSGSSQNVWEGSNQGLSPRDLAMNVAMPELDGRVLSRAIAFKNSDHYALSVQANIVRHVPLQNRVDFVADLAKNWCLLAQSTPHERRFSLILANYPNKDGRLANGVGLDTPAGTVELVKVLRRQGYQIGTFPDTGQELVEYLQAGPTNAEVRGREIRECLSILDYKKFFAQLSPKIQDEVKQQWGEPESDPAYLDDQESIALTLARFDNLVVGLQPTRGYNIDPVSTYHSPDLVPPHSYFAFYFYLRYSFGNHAVVHMGKHGTMEWLPGKALALDNQCYPEAVLGATPHLYPFIVNDPGEGTQAKRRSSAVIIDHLTPPLTRAESYGPLKELEALVDEYYESKHLDPRRLMYLRTEILNLMSNTGLDYDSGVSKTDDEIQALEKLDAYLCELKEMQIRDGLHIFGKAPEGRLLTDLTVALARLPRDNGERGNNSLHRALALDCRLNFDPLDCQMEKAWDGPRPQILQDICEDLWRSYGDTVERLELLAALLVDGKISPSSTWYHTCDVLDEIRRKIKPSIEACGVSEITQFSRALSGHFVPPGPSGAPTRGKIDVLPTGRNFYSVDSRSIPTPAAWHLGQKSADLLIRRYCQDYGEWPKSIGLSAWGTSNMRTGGDDIAQALALIGARPLWDHASRRVTGFEVITLAELGRSRVDVTLRISGFFRDAFPTQIELFDRAVRAIAELEEEVSDNPIAAAVKNEAQKLEYNGCDPEQAILQAGYRVYGSKPGAYGVGLQALIDHKCWENRSDLAKAYLAWGGYAYGLRSDGKLHREQFGIRLTSIQAVIQNQDNREHDLLDSDDYYQFEGGMTAAVEHISGYRPIVYHNDHSYPQRPKIRTLEEEISRVVRARVVNPKWINGVMRHGYKGAFEIAATFDYMFAFSATTGAVRDYHFDAVYQAFIADETVREFLADKNPHALQEIAERFLEAMDRRLWTARSNSARHDLEKLTLNHNKSSQQSGVECE
ncbi:cobaltochelatase subunit CobN [Candidatus Endowatersipora endosymbiont of Watersipora subatra]|uniref:cobaltochelatase subunit CobN n=1 Tax=Candidatus Endowatersipora endosymbiont of Watersipora subatra TaxID=3077946 RepID=UPI00312C8366